MINDEIKFKFNAESRRIGIMALVETKSGNPESSGNLIPATISQINLIGSS